MKKSTLLTILLHAGYWQPALIVLYTTAILGGGGHDHDFIVKQGFVGAFVAVTAFYVFYIFLFPFLYKRVLKFIGYGSLAVLVTLFVGLALLMALTSVETARFGFPFGMSIVYLVSRILGCATFACILKGFITWFTDIKYREALEKKNLETSLALLKAQINPHFLFNTLNNIDVLIEKDPVVASAYLKKLSDILRFTLYESPAETVPLQQEVTYIEQYIELQKIRTTNPDFVKFEVAGEMKYMDIAPMLFIPFIENAFKHSTNKKISNAVVISIASDGRTITFECGNAYEPILIEHPQQSGLGLGLIKNRLDLLYPDRYNLDIDKTNDRFMVKLKIYLNDN